MNIHTFKKKCKELNISQYRDVWGSVEHHRVYIWGVNIKVPLKLYKYSKFKL